MYFTAQLQTSPHNIVRIVSFSPEKRSEFCKNQDAKSAVKISNFKLSTKKGSNDVVINNNTSIESVHALNFAHQELSTPNMSTISSLQKVSLEQLISVHAKVVKLSAVKSLQTSQGSLKKQEAVIVDETSSIKLVLWENHVDCL